MYKKIILIITISLVLCGCARNTYIADNPLTKDEIIKLIQDEAYKKTNEEVAVKIISKEKYEICTAWLDECHAKKKIKGVYSYYMEITNKKNKDIVGRGYYHDGYIHGVNVTKPVYSIDDYLDKINTYPAKKDLEKLLNDSFNDYILINSSFKEDDYDIFVYSPEYDKTKELINNIDEINVNYENLGMDINVFILKDKSAYHSLNYSIKSVNDAQRLGEQRIELYTNKRATKFDGVVHELEYDYFTNNGSKSFNYVILWYHGYPYFESNGFFEKYGLK